MTTTVEAIYEGGVLRPTQPIPLAEGTRVDVVIITREVATEATTPAEILAAIAAMPPDGDGSEPSAHNYDKILYGEEDARSL